MNSTNVTDPVTGGPAINLPIDVVASVQVISNPYDPEYGRFTGAVSTISTKTSDYDKFHFSIQNFIPRLRDRDDSIMGIGAATPRTDVHRPAREGAHRHNAILRIPVCAHTGKQPSTRGAG